MQMAYNNLQMSPRVRIGLVQHGRRKRAPRPGVWSQPFCHPRWTLDYCGWNGHCTRLSAPGLQRSSFSRPPCSWHLYAPGTIYHEREDHPDIRHECLWFQFTLNSPLAPFTGRPYFMVLDPHGRLVEHVKTMYAAQHAGEPGGALILHGLLLTVLGEIAAAAYRGGTGLPDQPFVASDPVAAQDRESLLARVDAALAPRLQAPPALDGLALLLDMSVSSLSHRFRAEAGITIVERIRWLRIREARRLLGQQGSSVKSVARKLGFSSPYYFSRVFTEVTDLSPSSYLRQLRGR